MTWEFVNPYNFVGTPPVQPADRQQAGRLEKLEGLWGSMVCELTALTPMFVPKWQPQRDRGSQKHRDLHFFTVNGKIAIPASSLKGVIRSIAEAASHSCFSVFDGEYEEGKLKCAGALPEDRNTVQCIAPDRLCIVCRLFGKVGEGDSTAVAGKVYFGDAPCISGHTAAKAVILKPLQVPHPGCRRHYFHPVVGQPEVRGRKFYYHQPKLTLRTLEQDKRASRFNVTVRPVDAGAKFCFTIEYAGLRQDELNLLVYALELEQGVCHKLGMGKPRGLGSARIEIVKAQVRQPTARYRSLGADDTLPITDVHSWSTECKRPYVSSNAPHLQDLRTILRYDHDYAVVRYPTGPELRRHLPLFEVGKEPKST